MTKSLPKRLLFTTAFILAFGFALVRAVQAQVVTTTRPGWGFGYDNHVHTGPPGISVRPAREPRASGLSFRPIPDNILEQILAYIFSTPGIED